MSDSELRVVYMTTQPEVIAELRQRIMAAVKDYRRVYPEPNPLAPNLALAVEAMALLVELMGKTRTRRWLVAPDGGGEPTLWDYLNRPGDAPLAVLTRREVGEDAWRLILAGLLASDTEADEAEVLREIAALHRDPTLPEDGLDIDDANLTEHTESQRRKYGWERP